MRMMTKAATARRPTAVTEGAALQQRTCACGGECAKCRRDGTTVAPDRETRASAEPRFAHDFGNLRVQTKKQSTTKGDGEGGPHLPTAPTYGVTPTGSPPGDTRSGAPSRKCKIKSGPKYTPSGTIKATKSGGEKRASFDMSAEFESDPTTGADPSCCEARQYVLWTKAEEYPHHDGFKPHTDYKENVYYEDRDSAGKRYGRRTGPYSECVAGNRYEDSAGKANCRNGAMFKANDAPVDGSGAKTGEWRFQLRVIDVCNKDAEVGKAAAVKIDWNV